eukprot:1157979-Pelagomonas_calceolata.AAC.4
MDFVGKRLFLRECSGKKGAAAFWHGRASDERASDEQAVVSAEQGAWPGRDGYQSGGKAKISRGMPVSTTGGGWWGKAHDLHRGAMVIEWRKGKNRQGHAGFDYRRRMVEKGTLCTGARRDMWGLIIIEEQLKCRRNAHPAKAILRSMLEMSTGINGHPRGQASTSLLKGVPVVSRQDMLT